jgi:hypothetical protein
VNTHDGVLSVKAVEGDASHHGLCRDHTRVAVWCPIVFYVVHIADWLLMAFEFMVLCGKTGGGIP